MQCTWFGLIYSVALVHAEDKSLAYLSHLAWTVALLARVSTGLLNSRSQILLSSHSITLYA